MIGTFQFGIALTADDTGCRVKAKRFRACENPVGQGDDTLHAGNDFIAVSHIASAFPFRHPVSGVCQPVGTNAQAGRGGARIFATWLCQTHWVESIELLFGVFHLGHEISTAFVRSEIIVEAIPGSLTDACFLGATSPMADVVTTTQSGILPYVVDIYLGCMAGHSLCHTPNVCTSCAQKIIPKPHIGGQFCIVPSKASDIVSPGVANRVIRMHDVAVVPETIPFVLFDGLFVEVDIGIQTIFHPAAEWSTAIRKAPDAKGLLRVQVFGGRHQYTRFRKLLGTVGKSLFPGISSLRDQGERSSAGNSIGCAQAFLNILVTGI